MSPTVFVFDDAQAPYLSSFRARSECRILVAAPGTAVTAADLWLFAFSRPTDDGAYRLLAMNRALRQAPCLLLAERHLVREAQRALVRPRDAVVPREVDGVALAQIVRETLALPQRRAARIPVELMIRIAPASQPNEVVRARTSNLSSSGARVRTQGRFSVGDRLKITLNLSTDRQPLSLGAVVRRCEGEHPPFDYGVQFTACLAGNPLSFIRDLGIPLSIP